MRSPSFVTSGDPRPIATVAALAAAAAGSLVSFDLKSTGVWSMSTSVGILGEPQYQEGANKKKQEVEVLMVCTFGNSNLPESC